MYIPLNPHEPKSPQTDPQLLLPSGLVSSVQVFHMLPTLRGILSFPKELIKWASGQNETP